MDHLQLGDREVSLVYQALMKSYEEESIDDEIYQWLLLGALVSEN